MKFKLVLVIIAVFFSATFSLVEAQQPFWQATTENTLFRNSAHVFSEYVDGSLIACGGSLFRSTDNGVTWNDVPGTTFNTRIFDILVLPSGEIFLATTAGLLHSSNLSSEWNTVPLPEQTGALSVGISSHNVMFVRTNKILFSTDFGTTWIVAKKGLPRDLGSDGFDRFSMGPNGEVFFACNKGVYVTRTDGKLWNRLPLSHNPERNNAHVVVRNDGSMIALTSQKKRGAIIGRVYVSKNLGRSWKAVKAKNAPILVFAFNADKNGSLFVGTQLGVYHSEDNGSSWTLTNTIENVEGYFDCAFSLTIAPDHHLIAGTNRGIIRSIDPIIVNSQTTSLFSNSLEISTSYMLSQNYPNPFNPSTAISYQLPNDSRVTLTVFNMLGQEVAKLVDGIQEAGEQKVDFDASKLSSGMYYYKITAQDIEDAGEKFTEVKKMLLMK